MPRDDDRRKPTMELPSITEELEALDGQKKAEPAPAHSGRQAARLPANFMVLVRNRDREQVVKARDLSATGIFLLGLDALPARTRVRIPLEHGVEIYAFCSVVRVEPEGVAVEFDALEWEDRQHLLAFLGSLDKKA